VVVIVVVVVVVVVVSNTCSSSSYCSSSSSSSYWSSSSSSSSYCSSSSSSYCSSTVVVVAVVVVCGHFCPGITVTTPTCRCWNCLTYRACLRYSMVTAVSGSAAAANCVKYIICNLDIIYDMKSDSAVVAVWSASMHSKRSQRSQWSERSERSEWQVCSRDK
jgi:hypothetical protein